MRLLIILFWINVLFAQNRQAETLFAWHGQPAIPDSIGPLTTDRPDFTEAASTVGQGIIQLEMGYTYTKNTFHENAVVHSLGEPLVRVGLLANWFEVRFGLFPLYTSVEGSGSFGWQDSYLGLKLALTDQFRFLPRVAIIPQLSAPTGTADLTDGRPLPGTNLVYHWDLTEKLSLSGSTQFNFAMDDQKKQYISWGQSFSLGCSLTDQIAVYAEWYTFFPQNDQQVKTEHYFNGGVSYLPGRDLQFDARVGAGLTEVSDNFFFGVGLALRIRTFSEME